MDISPRFRIVVGVDGSRQSLLALEWALSEARLRQGRLRMVTGWEFPASTVGIDAPAWGRDSCMRVAEQIQRKALSKVDVEGVEIDRQVGEGSAAAVLLAAAADADLLVVGSRGHGGFRRLLLGSVSSQIVHHARCPVLLVRPRPVRPSATDPDT